MNRLHVSHRPNNNCELDLHRSAKSTSAFAFESTQLAECHKKRFGSGGTITALINLSEMCVIAVFVPIVGAHEK